MSIRRKPSRSRRNRPPAPQPAPDRASHDLIALVEAAQRTTGHPAKPINNPHADVASLEIPDLASVIGNATSEGDQLQALSAHLQRSLRLPIEGFVLGEPVAITDISYDGNSRRGITAACRRRGNQFTVSLADISFSPTPAAPLALYQQWVGLEPNAHLTSEVSSAQRPKVDHHDIELGQPVELVVLAPKSNALRCRLLGTAREVTLRTAVRDEVPGEIITVVPAKQWVHGRHPYLSGPIESSRLDVQALGLPPLALRPEGDWDPDDEDWHGDAEPIEAWAEVIIARGKRPAFEMEQVIPGADPDVLDSDPIFAARDLEASGQYAEARDVIMRLLVQDLRCLDAHAHLGNWAFEHRPKQALRHYATGVGIGALTLGLNFDGVLPWSLFDNRPFLRCLHGLGLSFWKLGHLREAAAAFRRLLWLNPSDHQDARFNLAAIEDGRTWEELEGPDA